MMPPSDHGSSGASRLWRWVCCSGALHLVIIGFVFIVPASTVKRPVSYPIYTVDLVGGPGAEGLISPASKPKIESPAPPKNEPVPKPKIEEAPVDDEELNDSVAKVAAPEELPAHVETDPPQSTEKAPKPPQKAEDVVKPKVEAEPAKIAKKTAEEKPKPKVEERPKVKKKSKVKEKPKVKKKVQKPAKKKTASSKKRVEKAKPKKPRKTAKKSSVAEKTKRKMSTAEKLALQRLREKRIEAAVAKVRERSATEEGSSAGAENNSLQQVARAVGTSRGSGAGMGDGTGHGGGVVRSLEFVIYRNRMLDQIKNSWTWMGNRNDLEVTVRFGVDSRGDVFGLRIVEASGDTSYDESVVRAVKRASPLPPPPATYLQDFSDVELTFRPKDLSG